MKDVPDDRHEPCGAGSVPNLRALSQRIYGWRRSQFPAVLFRGRCALHLEQPLQDKPSIHSSIGDRQFRVREKVLLLLRIFQGEIDVCRHLLQGYGAGDQSSIDQEGRR